MITPEPSVSVIIAVVGYRRKPWSCAFKASKLAYGINSYASLFVLMLFHVTATIKSTRFSVIIYKLLHKKKTFLSGRKVFGVEIRAGYLTSFGDERLEKFLSFFGVGEVEFGHFTKEFHAAVF